ncbi:hypothetical protein GCM10028773_45860 [Spirosoma koreense]
MVSIYDQISPLNESLHIDYELSDRGVEWLFSYYSGPSTEPEFKRRYSEGKLIEKFKEFLDKIAW